MIRSVFWATLGLAGCLSTVAPPDLPGYHNPLDHKDGGSSDGGGPIGDGGNLTYSTGTVQSRSPNLTTAVYYVELPDGGAPRTAIALGDVQDLCGALQSDAGGLGDNWDLLTMRLDGDIPTTYPVAVALAPSGAVAGFHFRSDAGAFGSSQAADGWIELDAVDPGDRQRAAGIYQVKFNGTDELSGRFEAAPCASLASGGN